MKCGAHFLLLTVLCIAPVYGLGDVVDADAFMPSLNVVDALMESFQIIPLG